MEILTKLSRNEDWSSGRVRTHTHTTQKYKKKKKAKKKLYPK